MSPAFVSKREHREFVAKIYALCNQRKDKQRLGLLGPCAGEVYGDVRNETGPCCADHCAYWFEIFRSDVSYKVLASPLLQGCEGTRVTFLSTYPAVA